MSCQTCGHTMNGISYGAFLCPRCGTHKTAEGAVYIPALVTRCREFAGLGLSAGGDKAAREWHRLGIGEAIHRPEDRK